ncbi:DUF3618 domain-containing protein [Marinobacter sp. ATCH36]|uniref:DUF3618 domain-containing protein n=1 Tax=Marinobacter sp. ATCH36 TaxID=2945106 RepID=UPI002021D0A6|nr:DUF3618 domain-containing protein [Marinobacter sp. ATCH36]MCL7945384.1 DUF3618 domain-containing protein [Marinobacter sp. ATCH36]
MTTAKEQFKNDLKKDPADLEREADGAREDLEGTVDKLMHQLSPTELLNRGISMVRNTGDVDFIRNLVNRVESNPIPTVLAGVSLIWLITASSSPNSSSRGSAERTRDAAERTREAGHKVAEGASDVMHRVRDSGRHTAENARSGLRDAREGYTQLLREQPLLVGILAVAAGATLGALLPRTSTEDRVMGDWSDRGTDAIKEKAEEKLQDLQGKASPDSAESYDTPAGGMPSAKTTNKTTSSSTGGEDAPAATGAGQSAAPPPPASPGSGSDSGKTHGGTNY